MKNYNMKKFIMVAVLASSAAVFGGAESSSRFAPVVNAASKAATSVRTFSAAHKYLTGSFALVSTLVVIGAIYQAYQTRTAK